MERFAALRVFLLDPHDCGCLPRAEGSWLLESTTAYSLAGQP